MISHTPSQAAQLDSFCRAHWQRLHDQACKRGYTAMDAEDAVQEVFLYLARLDLLDDLLQRSEDAQHYYLSLKLRNLLMNRWRNAHRQRRGGQMPVLSLNDEAVFGEANRICDKPLTSHHDRVWLANCITTAVSRLRQQTRAQTWLQISPALLDEIDAPQSGAQRVALHRARKKLRGLVREEMNGSFKDWSDDLVCVAD